MPAAASDHRFFLLATSAVLYSLTFAAFLVRLVTFASMGALVGWFAHSNRELSDRLRVAEERDPLTGLINTRAFDVALSARAELGRPFGLILADIDGLKAVNDRDGHAAGNDLLRRAADFLGRKLDRGDQLARVGGDEFAIITSTPGATPCAASAGGSRQRSTSKG
jgi:GGDEF domain-containing protein